MTKADRSEDDELRMALRHPLRRRILCAMAGREALSPGQLSATLRTPLSTVTYHVGVLAGCAAVSLVSTEAAGGSTRHFYSPAVEAPWVREILGLGEGPDREQGESSGDAST